MNTLRTESVRPTRRHPLAAAALLALLAATAVAGAAPAKAPKAAPAEPARADGRSEIGPTMTLINGKSTLMRLPYQAARMSVGDARIADVILLNKNEVYMVGKAVGTTNLILWNKNNDATIIDLSVVMDTAPLRARLDELLPQEKEIHISTAADTIVLSGMVADAPTAEQVVSVATAFVLRAASTSQQPVASGGAPPVWAAPRRPRAAPAPRAATACRPRIRPGPVSSICWAWPRRSR
jgi:pilus assembly protein CpaC